MAKAIVEDLYRTDYDSGFEVLRGNLGVPPSVNKMYHNHGKGGRRLSRTAEQYLAKIRAFTGALVEDQGWKPGTKGEWLYLDLYFFFPDRITRDSHNCLKILLDGLQGQCFDNDYYVMPRINLVEYDKENPRVFFELYKQTVDERQKYLHHLETMIY